MIRRPAMSIRKQYKGVCCTTKCSWALWCHIKGWSGGRGGLEIYPPDRQIRIDTSDLATAKLYFCISLVHEQILIYNICMISMYDYHTMIYCTSAYFLVGAHGAHWLLTFELNSTKEHSSSVTKDRLGFWASPYLPWYEQLPDGPPLWPPLHCCTVGDHKTNNDF